MAASRLQDSRLGATLLLVEHVPGGRIGFANGYPASIDQNGFVGAGDEERGYKIDTGLALIVMIADRNLSSVVKCAMRHGLAIT